MKKLHCSKCKNIWLYKGKNPYCANCSRCKSTVFIKKSSQRILKKGDLSDDFRGEIPKIIKNVSNVLEE